MAGIILFLGIGLAILAINLGQNAETKVNYSQLQSSDCSTKIQLLSGDYGKYVEQERFFLSGKEIEFVDFNNNWLVPISTKSGIIIEDSTGEYFQILYLKRSLNSLPEDYFSSTMHCTNVAAGKGNNDICKFVSVSNNVLDSPVTKVVVTMPTSSVEDTVKSLTKSGLFASAAGAGSGLIKLASGAEVGIILQFTENSTCDAVNVPKFGIWGISDYANGIFRRARDNNEFESNTISNLIGSSQLIIDLWSVKVERQFKETPLSKNPGLLEIVWFFFQNLFNAGAYAVGTIEDISIEVINFVQTPECNSGFQVAKFTQLNNILLDSNYLIADGIFNDKLKQYKDGALLAIGVEVYEKEKNKQNWWSCLVLAPKCVGYVTLGSNAQAYFDDQLYVSAKQNAFDFVPQYSKYWEEISWVDWLYSILFWGAIVLVAFLFTKFICSFGNNGGSNESKSQ